MWSRKFYHNFDELSTAVIRGIFEDKGEYATFWEVEPIWCSSSQSRRATNCATPGYLSVNIAGYPKQARFLLRCPKFSTRCLLEKFRPLPLACLASSATGSARLAPQLRYTRMDQGYYTESVWKMQPIFCGSFRRVKEKLERCAGFLTILPVSSIIYIEIVLRRCQR